MKIVYLIYKKIYNIIKDLYVPKYENGASNICFNTSH